MKVNLWVCESRFPGDKDWGPTRFHGYNREEGRIELEDARSEFPELEWRLRRYQAVEGSR